MVASPEKETKQKTVEDKENIIVEIFKKLLEINYLNYGGKKKILK